MFHNVKPIFIVLSLLTVLAAACGANAATTPSVATSAPPTQSQAGNTPATSSGSVSFVRDVMPILQSRCLSCHGGQQTQRGLSVASYDTLMAGSQNGPVIIPGDSANSLLVQLIQAGRMPKSGPGLTPAQIQTIVDWISAGALNN